MKICEVAKIPVQLAELWAEEKHQQEVKRRRMEVIRAGQRGERERRQEQRQAAAIARRQRAADNYRSAMKSINTTRNVAAACQTAGRSKKRVRNDYSTREAGTVQDVIVTRRFRDSRLTCVCKTKAY